MSTEVRDALQAVWDIGDELDSNHARYAASRVAERLGVSIRAHNDFSGPPRNRNEEVMTGLRAALTTAQEGLGSILWLGNNLHNWDTQKFRELFVTALGDVQKGYDAADAALHEPIP